MSKRTSDFQKLRTMNKCLIRYTNGIYQSNFEKGFSFKGIKRTKEKW